MAIFATPAIVSADIVVFDFVDNDATIDAASALVADFDPGAVGTAITVDGLTLTAVDIIGQNGSSALAAGENHALNIAGGQDALAVNDGGSGDIGGGADSSHFNPGEAVFFTFDQNVTLDQVEIESFTAGQEFNLVIAGLDGAADNVIALGDADNDFTDLAIAANQQFSFEFATAGTTGDTQVRIESFTATTVAVPEPSSLALLTIGGLVIGARRRKRA